MRLRLTVAYDGTDYHGWQIQPDRRTIQQSLEEALATVLREPVRVEAAGRTDAGVHARGQIVAASVTGNPDLCSLQRSLNALCRPGVAILAIGEASEGFDPRRDASSRTYQYRIRNHPAPSPFSQRYAWYVPQPLDVESMQEAANAILGEHDFRSFQAADCDADNPVRRVFESLWRREDEELVYEIRATAFLRHMVRNIVGTLVEVGRGARTVADFHRLLAATDRRLAGATAPAHGLCLVRVDYPTGAAR